MKLSERHRLRGSYKLMLRNRFKLRQRDRFSQRIKNSKPGQRSREGDLEAEN